mmetsp:Transcript_16642/g.24884  ORF Transcript_16642/g.24884 Transcript_16642/m.24884 type:complete len:133 (+) Transcript_16642:255-653(+)
MVTSNSSFNVSNVEAIDLGKSSNPINTGVGFFDHMLDQLNSHAQVGVSVKVLKNSTNGDGDGDGNGNDASIIEDRNRHAHPPESQEELMSQVGSALGAEIRKLIPSTANKSRFCCPLDEALVECTLAPNKDS